MSRLKYEALSGNVTNERLVTTLVSLAMARPDLVEAFTLTAAVFGVRRTFQSELEETELPLIFIERPEPARLEGARDG